jgi:hypothetical protein
MENLALIKTLSNWMFKKSGRRKRGYDAKLQRRGGAKWRRDKLQPGDLQGFQR